MRFFQASLSPSAATRQTARRWRHVVAVLLVFGAAMGSGRLPGAHAAALPFALLSAADLPAGWTVAGPLDADAGVPFVCPSSAVPVPPAARFGELLVGSADELAYQTVAEYGPGEAAQLLTIARSESASCGWQQPMDDGAAVRLTLLPATAAPWGEESARRHLELRGAGTVVTADLLLIRRGDQVTQLTHLVLGRDTTAHDALITQLLAQAADQRLGLASP